MAIPAESHHSVCFGEFDLDLHTGELRSKGQKTYLQDKPFRILLALLEHPGQLLSREELQKRLWPADTFVDFEHSLNKAVNRLREVLNDSAEHPHFIETLPRRGYRFIAPVTNLVPREPVILVPGLSSSSGRPGVVRENASAIPRSPAMEVVSPRRAGISVALRDWKYATAIVLVALAAVAAAGFGLRRWLSPANSLNLENMQIEKLTDSGTASDTAISPDGRYIVYAVNEGEIQSLRVRQVATRSDVQILPPDPAEFHGLTVSPDGNYVFFSAPKGIILSPRIYIPWRFLVGLSGS